MKGGKYITLFVAVFLTVLAFGQLPSKVEQLEGVWKYKEGSGYEIWRKSGDQLIGNAFRLNQKTGDSSKIEDVFIRRVNKNLIYTMKTYNYVNDSIKENVHNFVGGKRKMKWHNIDSNTPYMIKYSYGFFNRNKLIMRIYYGPHDKPTKLILFRQKD